MGTEGLGNAETIRPSLEIRSISSESFCSSIDDKVDSQKFKMGGASESPTSIIRNPSPLSPAMGAAKKVYQTASSLFRSISPSRLGSNEAMFNKMQSIGVLQSDLDEIQKLPTKKIESFIRYLETVKNPEARPLANAVIVALFCGLDAEVKEAFIKKRTNPEIKNALLFEYVKSGGTHGAGNLLKEESAQVCGSFVDYLHSQHQKDPVENKIAKEFLDYLPSAFSRPHGPLSLERVAKLTSHVKSIEAKSNLFKGFIETGKSIEPLTSDIPGTLGKSNAGALETSGVKVFNNNPQQRLRAQAENQFYEALEGFSQVFEKLPNLFSENWKELCSPYINRQITHEENYLYDNTKKLTPEQGIHFLPVGLQRATALSGHASPTSAYTKIEIVEDKPLAEVINGSHDLRHDFWRSMHGVQVSCEVDGNRSDLEVSNQEQSYVPKNALAIKSFLGQIDPSRNPEDPLGLHEILAHQIVEKVFPEALRENIGGEMAQQIGKTLQALKPLTTEIQKFFMTAEGKNFQQLKGFALTVIKNGDALCVKFSAETSVFPAGLFEGEPAMQRYQIEALTDITNEAFYYSVHNLDELIEGQF